MNRMKWLGLVVTVVVVLGLSANAMAVDSPKTVTGKSTCGGCTGVVDGCCLMLTDDAGVRWIIRGNTDSLKAAFKARHSGKSMTATLASEPETKKGKDGKDYKEAQASAVKVAS
jgi:hypothetical protein